MNVRTLMALIGLAAATGGCALFHADQSCHKPQAYESSRSIARLKVPAGVDAPDTRDALVVPHVDAPEAPRSRSGACLDEPPRYRNDLQPQPDGNGNANNDSATQPDSGADGKKKRKKK
jgi:uncharacterized lipoprotein